MTPIQKAAHALQQAWNRNDTLPPLEFTEREAEHLARAVLATFADPTDLSGLALRQMPGEYRAGSHSAREIYQALFKAMMEETDGTD